MAACSTENGCSVYLPEGKPKIALTGINGTWTNIILYKFLHHAFENCHSITHLQTVYATKRKILSCFFFVVVFCTLKWTQMKLFDERNAWNDEQLNSSPFRKGVWPFVQSFAHTISALSRYLSSWYRCDCDLRYSNHFEIWQAAWQRSKNLRIWTFDTTFKDLSKRLPAL